MSTCVAWIVLSWVGVLVILIGLASDDVKLVLNNNSVPGYGHTHVHKDWKILCRTQALFRDWPLLRQALLWASVDQREFFLLPSLAKCFILTTNLETGRESCFFQAPRSPDAVSVACMRTRVNSVLVLRPVDCGSMFAGKWDHQSERAEGRWNMSRQSKKQTVYSTCWESATFSPRRICLFSPLKNSVVIESNTNRNICSMENTKIKARWACKLLFTKKQVKEKRSWSVRRSPIHSLCVSHRYEPTPRLFRTRIALLCENDAALASPIVWTLVNMSIRQKIFDWNQLCERQNGHRDKFRCYRRLHDQGRSSDNFENQLHRKKIIKRQGKIQHYTTVAKWLFKL